MSTGGLRPLRVGEILDAAIKLYVRNARVLMGAAATVVVPLQVLVAIVLLSSYRSGSDIPTGTFNISGSPADASARLGATGIISLANLIGTSLVLCACVKAISDSYLGHPTGIGVSLRFAGRRLLAFLGNEVLYIVGLIIAFILVVIPGIWLYCMWSVRVPALVIERAGPIKALSRSFRLVRGRWWPSAAVLIVSTVMVAVIGGVIGGLLTAFVVTSHPSTLFAVLIAALSSLVSNVILQPFTAAVITVLYYDLRIRREGFDVQLMAEQLGIPAEALPAGWESPGTYAGGGIGPEMVGQPGGPPFWPPPPGWRPDP